MNGIWAVRAEHVSSRASHGSGALLLNDKNPVHRPFARNLIVGSLLRYGSELFFASMFRFFTASPYFVRRNLELPALPPVGAGSLGLPESLYGKTHQHGGWSGRIAAINRQAEDAPVIVWGRGMGLVPREDALKLPPPTTHQYLKPHRGDRIDTGRPPKKTLRKGECCYE